MNDVTGISDEELIDKCRDGDRPAFNELIERYKKMAFSLAFNMTGSTEDAEDIAQDSFVIVFRKIRKFRGESSFKTWLYRIVLNLCRRLYRKKKLRAMLPLTAFSRQGEERTIDIQTDVTPESTLESRQTGALTAEAIKKLPLRQREIFIMKHVKGMKIREISKVLGRSEGTIKSHLFRAVKGLQTRLGGI